jgi:putative transposase
MAKVVRDVPAPIAGAYGQPARIRYEADDRIILDGFDCDWRCKETTIDGHILVAGHDTKFTRAYSHDQMRIEADKPRYRHDRHWYSTEAAKARLRAGVSLLSDLPYKVRQRVLWKEDLILEFENLKARFPKTVTGGDEPLERAILQADQNVRRRYSKIANDGKRARAGRLKPFPDPPGPKAFRGWLKDYEEGGRTALSLSPRTHRSGNRDERLTSIQAALTKKFVALYPSPNRPSRRKIWRAMKSHIERKLNPQRKKHKLRPIAVPSYGRVYREIEIMDFFKKVAGREGIDVAMRKCQAIGDGIQDVLRPLQHVEIDHWTVNLMTILIWSGAWEKLNRAARRKLGNIGRMYLGLAMCRTTHVVLAMTLSRTASTESILRLLEMAISDKKHFADRAGTLTPYDISGVFEHLFSDGGSAINNAQVRAALSDLVIGFHCPPGGVPQLRGMAERMLRTIDDELLVWFEGRTFTDVVAKGEYDAASRTGTTVEELGRTLVRFAVDCHHNEPQAALGGKTPREMCLDLTKEHGVWPTPDSHLLRNIFGFDIERVLTAGGIRWLNIRYRSKKLHELFLKHGEIKVQCRVHSPNIGAMSVRLSKNAWLRVMAPKVFHRVDAESWIGAEAALRKHAQYTKREVTGPIINEALREFERTAQIGRKRADISDSPLSRTALLAAEARMRVFAAYPEDEYGDAPEPSTDIYQTSTPVTGATVERRRKRPPLPQHRGTPKAATIAANTPVSPVSTSADVHTPSTSAKKPPRTPRRVQRRPGFKRTFTLKD